MIKIEVTGNSIGEVADKLLAIGANLRGSAIVEGARAAVNAMQAMGVAEAAPAPLPSSGQTEAPQPTEEKASASLPTEASDAPSELNFDTDVAPFVLQVVKEKGKPVAQEILSQFGVEKASLLDPTLWPELVQQLKDAL